MLACNSYDKQTEASSKLAAKSGSSIIQHGSQLCWARASLFSIIMRSLGTLVAALGVLISASQFVAAATTVDFFVYEGTQSGLTSGSTVTVSTGENQLALCVNTPSGTAPNVTYTPNCNTAAAPGNGLTDGNKYTAVAFIGTYSVSNNGTSTSYNLFAVGDLNGNVYIMYPTVNSSGTPQTMVLYTSTPYTYNCGTIACGQVIALAKDPNSNTLYISFANIAPSGSSQFKSLKNMSANVEAPQATLVVNVINEDGSLASTPSQTYQDFVWQDFSNNYGINGNGTFDYVSPKLRVYPPGYPGLSGTNYSTTGAVFYSGIIGNDNPSPNGAAQNKGYLCSGTQCQVSFNITLQGKGTGFDVMTSAEYGVDIRGSTPVPVLYWNQVSAGWLEERGPIFYVPKIVGNTSNLVQSCQLPSLVNPTLTNSACLAYVPLSWPPAAGPSVGPFVNEMVYLPTPTNSTATPPAPYGNPSSVGVLMMSVWSPGYLAYHALDGNEGTALLFAGNGSNGEIGANPVSLIPDLSGSVFMEAGAEGLVGFNIFAENNNLGTNLDQSTYIDITSGSSSSGSSANVGGIVLNGIDIVGSVCSTIGLYVALAPNPTNSIPKVSTPASIGLSSALTLKGALGNQPHRGRYTYDEATMKKMGIKRGQWISGLRLAVAEGISSRPKQDVKVEEFQLQLESGGKVGGRPSSSYPKTVIDHSLCIASNSYERTKGPGSRRAKRYGFGPAIWFDRPYRYLGGDLTMSIFGSGYSYGEFPFYIEAATGSGVSGAYVTGPSALGVLPSDYPEVHAAPNVIFQKGRRSYGSRSLQCQ